MSIIKYNSKHVLSVVLIDNKIHLITANELDSMPKGDQGEILHLIIALYLKNMETDERVEI